jgi:hypothetical protein
MLIALRTSDGWCQWLTPVTLTAQEAKIERILLQGQPGKVVCETPISKKAEQNVLEVIGHLLCKCELLSSNPSPTKKDKKPF